MRVWYFRHRQITGWALVLMVGLLVYYLGAGTSSTLVPVLSWALAGRTIVVDPGHGGIDPGAVGPGGTLEKDITLAVSLRLADELRQSGARVILTRETDTDLSTPGKSLSSRKREDLDNRLAVAREAEADCYVSIQVNSFGTRWTGAQTFYYPGSETGQQLAEYLQAELQRVLGNTTRQAKTLDVYILRQLHKEKIPAVLVEIGFISNAAEERLLNDPLYQSRLAYAIAAGLAKTEASAPEVESGENNIQP